MKILGKHNFLRRFFWVAILAAMSFSGIAQAVQYESQYKTVYRYSAMGLQLGLIKPDADSDSRNFMAQRFVYGDSSRPTLVTQIESGNLLYWLDDTIAPAQWTNFTVHTTRGFEYDSYGRKVKEWVKDANGTIEALTQYAYNSDGLVQCKARRMNKVMYASLPSDACTPGTPGAEGPDRITRYTYNDLDQVLTEERAVGTSLAQFYVTNTYDGYLLKTQTDANGNKTQLEYDAYDRLQYRYYPSKTTPGIHNPADYNEYAYDANNNIIMERKRNGAVINQQYDNNNRLVFKDYVNNTQTADIYYGYDLRGLTLHARYGSDTGQGITNRFDGFGSLLSSTSNMGGVTRTVSNGYDANGNRRFIAHPDGQYFSYTYDQLNRVKGVSDSATANNNLLSVSYLSSGQRDNITRASGSQTAYAYPNGIRLESFSQRFTTANNNLTNSFTYNPAGQVTTLTQSNSQYSYIGNNDRAGIYLPNGLNQYTHIAGQPLSYDANGNMGNDGFSTYTFDDENRLLSASGSGLNASLVYDPNGRLFQTNINGTIRHYLYDGDALIAEYVNGTLQRRYVHGDQVDEPWVQYNGTSVASSERRYLHANHQGSIIAHSNSSGSVINTIAYDAFGIPASMDMDTFAYTGQIWLKGLNLYYYKARLYSPRIGRFLQTDPIFYEDQMNMYAYVGNDPINKTDPTGKYARGDGWSDEQWKKFDAAQKAAASSMTKTASTLRQTASDMRAGKDVSAPKGAEGSSAKDMDKMASKLEAGARALNDNGKLGYVAHQGKAGGDFARADVGGKTMTVNASHAAFERPQRAAFMAGHESLHNAGLRDQQWAEQTAYRFTDSFGQQRAYKNLPEDQRWENPDHVMSIVYP